MTEQLQSSTFDPGFLDYAESYLKQASLGFTSAGRGLLLVRLGCAIALGAQLIERCRRAERENALLFDGITSLQERGTQLVEKLRAHGISAQ